MRARGVQSRSFCLLACVREKVRKRRRRRRRKEGKKHKEIGIDEGDRGR